MSIGLVSNIGGSVAGTALAQFRGSDVERAQQESAARDLRADSAEKAEMAAGVGQADGDDHQTADRDADGRQPWRLPQYQTEEGATDEAPRQSAVKDLSGQTGNMVDLSG